MSRRIAPIAGLSIALTLALAACGGSSGAPAGSAAAGACKESSAAGTVKVDAKDFTFTPSDISAKVGDVITFTNGDTTAHTASLVDGSCTTPNIAAGASDGLTFSAAGAYPYQCKIHPSTMKGTITVS
jgi:plastocyanin